ncbi:MAG: DNA-processing protein DprA [Firmicutes bacterium]|nr:DNA-processing protein DprA [Bacillota bacterium]
MDDDPKKYWIGIKMIPAFINKQYVLSQAAGGPKELWGASKRDLMELGLSESSADKAVSVRDLIDLDIEYKRLQDAGIQVITDEDKDYPYPLIKVSNRPKALFVKGRLRQYNAAVAVVGSRRATAAGMTIAHELALDLANSGVAVVSGAARGIDTSAHWGALDAGGTTFAVLGCGLDIVYPPENGRLFNKIRQHGALISEYHLGTPPLAMNFPARNRIVAGMCDGVVIVEAAEKSGALITVDFALEYGRDVFAIPGHAKSFNSKGTNKLIKQGAYLVENAKDVLEILGFEHVESSKSKILTPREKAVLDIIGWNGKRIDEIAGCLSESSASVSALIVSLEVNGLVKRDLSGSYMRIR